VDGRVLVYALGLSVLAGLLVGLAPLGQTLRHDLTHSLRAGPRGGSYQRSRLRGFLVLLQATLSVVLLVGAGLFARSLRNIRGMDLGMDPERVLVVTWTDALLADVNGGDREGFHARALESLQRLPVVEHASLSVTSPFFSSLSTDLRMPGRDSIPRLADGGPYVNGVTPDYFATMGTRIVEGRGFTDADREGAPRVTIVSQTMARILWPGETPLGQCLIIGSDDAPCSEVIGVAADAARQSLSRDPVMQYYVPLAQNQLTANLRVLFARTRGDASKAISAVRKEVQALDAALPFADIRTLESMIDPNVRPWRLGASLFGSFGALALLLAAVGLYSVIAYSVAQRTQEMGVRIALGARAAHVLRLVLSRAIATAAAGIAIGLFIAVLVGDAVQPLLFEESAHDPIVLLGVAAVLLVTGIVAGSIPAFRATRVDPVTAMHAE
jgi:predicted permease